MTQDSQNEKHYIAAEGKVFQRIYNGFNEIKTPTVYGSELFLGKILVDGEGKLLEEPIDDKIEYYQEINEPIREENEVNE